MSGGADMADTRIGIAIVAGALGSGKSTFIDALIGTARDDSILVLLTELGNHVLRHQRVVTASLGAPGFGPGCQCCSFENELLGVLDLVAEEAHRGEIKPFRTLVVELADGVDPAVCYALPLAFPAIRERYRVDSMTLLVQTGVNIDTAAMNAGQLAQFSMADRAILANQPDKKAAGKTAKWLRSLAAISPNAQILSWRKAVAAGKPFWSLVGQRQAASASSESLDAANAELPQRLVIEDAEPVARRDLELWLEWVRYRYGAIIPLMMGMALTREDSGPVFVNMVRHTLAPREAFPAWGEMPRQTKIDITVLGGRGQDILALWQQAKAGTLPGKLVG